MSPLPRRPAQARAKQHAAACTDARRAQAAARRGASLGTSAPDGHMRASLGIAFGCSCCLRRAAGRKQGGAGVLCWSKTTCCLHGRHAPAREPARHRDGAYDIRVYASVALRSSHPYHPARSVPQARSWWGRADEVGC